MATQSGAHGRHHPYTHMEKRAKDAGRPPPELDRLDDKFFVVLHGFKRVPKFPRRDGRLFDDEDGPEMSGSGKPEGNAIYKRVAEEAYKSDPAKEVDGFTLIASSPTLKFYAKGSDVLVGIRGTQDFADAKADAAITIGALDNTQRFKTDLAFMEKVKSENPDKVFYGAAHSLGGAILDLFISRGLIQSGKSINAALQLGKEETANERIYNSGDALYKLSRPFLKQSPLVETKKPSTMGRFFGLYNLLEQHRISGSGKRSRAELNTADNLGDVTEDRPPTAEELADALGRAGASGVHKRVESMEARLATLSKQMFNKKLDDLNDDEMEQLDAAFEEAYGGDSESSSGSSEDDEAPRGTEYHVKARRGPKIKPARKRSFLRFLKKKASMRYYAGIMRRVNERQRKRREDPDYAVPEDEDSTDYEYDSDDDEDERPPGEWKWSVMGPPKQPRTKRKNFRKTQTKGFIDG